MRPYRVARLQGRDVIGRLAADPSRSARPASTVFAEVFSLERTVENLIDDAVAEALDVDRGLVGVDDRDDVAAVHVVTGRDQPLHDSA